MFLSGVWRREKVDLGCPPLLYRPRLWLQIDTTRGATSFLQFDILGKNRNFLTSHNNLRIGIFELQSCDSA